jgi:hypothetical protein
MLNAQRFLFSCAIFCLGLSISAQNNVSGYIFESEMLPLEYANVLLMNTGDSSLFKGTVTDLGGFFQIENIPNGRYFLTASMIGFETMRLESFDLDDQILFNIPKIILSQGIALEEVQVVGRKPLYEQKIDRLVVNVENSIISSGSSALDILERSPA